MPEMKSVEFESPMANRLDDVSELILEEIYLVQSPLLEPNSIAVRPCLRKWNLVSNSLRMAEE